MFQLLKEMGVLRNLLHATALVFTVLMPLALAPGYSDGWNLFFSGILPATAPLVVIVIALDITMSQVWKSGASDEVVAAMNRVIKAHLVFGGALLASWLVVFLPALWPA